MVELLFFSLLQCSGIQFVNMYFCVHQISKVYDVTKSLMHLTAVLYVLIRSESDHFNSMEDFVTLYNPILRTVTLLVNNVCN